METRNATTKETTRRLLFPKRSLRFFFVAVVFVVCVMHGGFVFTQTQSWMGHPKQVIHKKNVTKMNTKQQQRSNNNQKKRLGDGDEQKIHPPTTPRTVELDDPSIQKIILIPNEPDLVGAQNSNHSIVLDGVVSSLPSPFANCSPTTQVRLIVKSTASHPYYNYWILQSFDSYVWETKNRGRK